MIGVVIDDRPGCNWTVLLELWIAPLPTQYFWCWQADGMVALGSMMIVSGTVFSSLICYVTCCIDLFWIYTAFICLWLSRVYFCGTVSWSCTNKKRMMYYSLLWCMECQTITIVATLITHLRWTYSKWNSLLSNRLYKCTCWSFARLFFFRNRWWNPGVNP